MKCMEAFGLLATSLALMAGTASAQDAIKRPHVPLEKSIGQVSDRAPVASLIVINADGATLDGDKLALTGVSPNSIIFSDRPVRAAGHIPTSEIVDQWSSGPDSFDEDPPNATVSILGGGSDVSDSVVTLRSPKLEGATLTFDVSVLEGALTGATGPAALFIDHGRGWKNAGWYALGAASGAVIGAGLAAPRYPEPYYPPAYYPPVAANPCPPGYWLGPWGHCRDTPYHGRLPNGQWQ